MTIEEIRAQVEAGRRAAKVRFDRDMGTGAYERMSAMSRDTETRKRALDDICAALDKAETAA
jgi:hypothetical protein